MKAIVFALVLCTASGAAIAQSGTHDPPTAHEIVDALGGDANARIYNLHCNRIDHRTFSCEFDMPPGAGIPHVSIQAVWVGSGWSIDIRH